MVDDKVHHDGEEGAAVHVIVIHPHPTPTNMVLATKRGFAAPWKLSYGEFELHRRKPSEQGREKKKNGSLFSPDHNSFLFINPLNMEEAIIYHGAWMDANGK